MKIIQLVAENFKRLKAVSIRPDGSLVQITGRNEQGKSTVLDAIAAAIGGSAFSDEVSIRTGEKKAHITLDLGEYVVTRKFTPSGGSLTVEAANGAQFKSPQKMLDDLIGSLSFDPLAFTRMKPDKQLETLRSMVHLETDIDALDLKTKQTYEARTIAKLALKSLQARLAAVPAFPDDTPDEPVDTMALVSQMNEAGKANANLAKQVAARLERKTHFERIREYCDAQEAQALAMLETVRTDRAKAQQLEESYNNETPLSGPVDTDELANQIEKARQVNTCVATKQTAAKLKDDIYLTEQRVEQQTETIDLNGEIRAAAIASAEMPVAGLGFGEGMVLYKDLPFAQASQAEQIRVSVAIAMAGNPKLRIISIRDGSLLDEQAMQALEEMADLNDFQIWVERVDSSGKIGIVIEDGAVVPHE